MDTNFGLNTNIIVKLYHTNQKQLLRIIVRAIRKSNIKYNNYAELYDIAKTPIIKYMNDKTSDAKIIDTYRNLITKKINLYSEKPNQKKSIRTWDIISKYIPHDLKIKKILDFGGNVGDNAHCIGQILKLVKKNIYVMDVTEWEGIKWTPRKDITFVHYDEMDKLPSDSIDYIFAGHVLHHINKTEHIKIIKMFNRVLTKKGIIVISEHNVTVISHELVDLIHMLFDVVIAKQQTYKKFCSNYKANYFPKLYWINLFKPYFTLYNTIDQKTSDATVGLYFKRGIKR
jgi:ubiquinone/menaquinone biosynthesis C-methylase UbiE